MLSAFKSQWIFRVAPSLRPLPPVAWKWRRLWPPCPLAWRLRRSPRGCTQTLAFASATRDGDALIAFVDSALFGSSAQSQGTVATVGQVVTGFVPIIGQIADARDLVAALRSFVRGSPTQARTKVCPTSKRRSQKTRSRTSTQKCAPSTSPASSSLPGSRSSCLKPRPRPLRSSRRFAMD